MPSLQGQAAYTPKGYYDPKAKVLEMAAASRAVASDPEALALGAVGPLPAANRPSKGQSLGDFVAGGGAYAADGAMGLRRVFVPRPSELQVPW